MEKTVDTLVPRWGCILHLMKALSLGIVLLAATAAHADLRSDATSLDKAVTAAMKKKDFPALEKAIRAGLAPNFVYMEGGQKQTTDEMISNMKMGLGAMKKLNTVATKVLSVKQSGNTGTVSTVHVMSGVTAGQDKKPHILSFTGMSQDTYVKIGGKWKMSKMVMKTQKMTLDGKPTQGMGQ